MTFFRSALLFGLICVGTPCHKGATAQGASPVSLQADLFDPFGCGVSEDADSTCNRTAMSELANRNLRTLSYKHAREVMFQTIDVYENGDGVRVVDSVYSNDIFEVGSAGIPQNGVNTEHTWPQSFLKNYPRSNQTVCDLYHLYPVEARINGLRGNRPFAECTGEPDDEGRVSESCSAGFEPPEGHKGEVARAMFYLSVTYSMPIESNEEKILRRWNADFPVTAHESERARKVQEVQGNVNPFVIHPEWADLISDF